MTSKKQERNKKSRDTHSISSLKSLVNLLYIDFYIPFIIGATMIMHCENNIFLIGGYNEKIADTAHKFRGSFDHLHKRCDNSG